MLDKDIEGVKRVQGALHVLLSLAMALREIDCLMFSVINASVKGGSDSLGFSYRRGEGGPGCLTHPFKFSDSSEKKSIVSCSV